MSTRVHFVLLVLETLFLLLVTISVWTWDLSSPFVSSFDSSKLFFKWACIALWLFTIYGWVVVVKRKDA